MRKAITLSLAALVVLGVAYFGASWVVMSQGLAAEVNAIEQRPDELGVAYEEVSFSPRGWEELTLRGWWMAHEAAPGTIIWQHGLDSTKDSRLEVLVGLHAAGFNVLAFDLRGHGESDIATMGAGLHEQDDVLGGIDWLMSRGPAGKPVGLMGVSFGAGSVLMTAAHAGEVSAVMADSSFASLTDLMVGEIADRTPAPEALAGILRPGIVAVARLTRGIDVGSVVPERSVAELGYPIALVHCRDDERIDLNHAERIHAAASAGSTLAVVDGCEHGKASDIEGDAYVARAFAYFTERFLAP